MILFYGVFLYCLSSIVSGNEIFVDIQYSDNRTFIFYYNLTTDYPYFLTFRFFEHEQIKFGLFSARIRENRFRISDLDDSSTIAVYLFIICFHFIRPFTDIDIQCKDQRLLKPELPKSHLPTYKPLFVPMMYALSILMLLPVIIQHRRRKHAEFLKRRKQLRHLSISIVQDDPSILSKIVEHGALNLKKLPIEIELGSFPSTRTTLNDVDNNDTVSYKLRKSRIHTDKYRDEMAAEQSNITADDCIAHLLNSAPWNSSPIDHDSLEEQRVPMMNAYYDNEQSDSTAKFYRSNPAFIESDV